MNLTLLGQMGTFAVLVYFIYRFLWAPISNMLDERTRRIADGLTSAEKGKRELKLAEKRAGDIVRKAKEQAAEVLVLAEKRAGEVVDEAKDRARGEAKQLLEMARTEIEQERNRAREQLRTAVADLAVKAAEKILEKEVDARAHNRLLDDVVKQL